MKKPQRKTVVLSMRIDAEVLERVEAYRRSRETIPSRTAAVEALLDLGCYVWAQNQQEEKNDESSSEEDRRPQ